jgi:hypothetical protein
MKRVMFALLLAGLATMVIAQGAAAAPYVPPPTVDVGDTNPDPGDRIRVSGENWCAGSTVSIYLDGEFVKTVDVASDGTFSTTIDIPPGTSPGDHVIEVVGLDETCDEVRTVRVTIHVGGAGAAGGGTGALAFTGSNIWAFILLLAALLIVGTTALVAGRRRKTADARRQP